MAAANRGELKLALALLVAGLAGRAAIDKVLALRGGAEAVALWAQLGSVVELVANATLTGVGTGLAVLVAQAESAAARWGLLRQALRLGIAVSAAMLVLLGAAQFFLPTLSRFVFGSGLAPAALFLAAAVGALSVVPGLLAGFWQGQRHYGAMLLLALPAIGLQLAVLAGVGDALLLPGLLAAQFAFAVFVLAGLVPALRRAGGAPAGGERLRRFVRAGLSIGILSPLGALAMRAILADALSWQQVGSLQAFWRFTDWVTAIMSGLLALWFLPQLAASADSPRFLALLRRVCLLTLVPSALALGLIVGLRSPLAEFLYRPDFVLPLPAAVLFAAGDFVRVGSWVFLYALYARQQTSAIALGELLSLPLFAALLWAFPGVLDLTTAGALWLSSYLVYAGFNAWRVLRRGGGA